MGNEANFAVSPRVVTTARTDAREAEKAKVLAEIKRLESEYSKKGGGDNEMLSKINKLKDKYRELCGVTITPENSRCRKPLIFQDSNSIPKDIQKLIMQPESLSDSEKEQLKKFLLSTAEGNCTTKQTISQGNTCTGSNRDLTPQDESHRWLDVMY